MRMATTPVYTRTSTDGKSFEKIPRAQSRRNVMRLVTMILVITVRKVEAEEIFDLVTGSDRSSKTKRFPTKKRTGLTDKQGDP